MVDGGALDRLGREMRVRDMQNVVLTKRFCLALIGLAAVAGLAAPAAKADDYPNRPITIVVPFPPGGTNNTMARVVADKLSTALGQQVVVENRSGAGSGTVETAKIAHAAPDGHTILLAYTSTLATAPSLYPHAGYDPRKDFAPIGLIASSPSLLDIHPSLGVKTVADLIALIKKSDGTFQYGVPGIGTVNHLAGAMFAKMTGLKMTPIPYRGTNALMTDLIGGHIKMAFAPIPVSRGNIDSGRIHALAVTSPARYPLFPNLPTLAESGLAGFDVSLNYGLVAPAGTPRPIIERLSKELRAALASEDVKKRLATEGAVPKPNTPDEYAAQIDQEEIKWAKLIKEIGIKPK